MSKHTVSRHFVTVEGNWGTRQVHYRRTGSGPALLLLHQSPQSSREFEGLMQAWGESFTVLAPDSPGYGKSDPLGVNQAGLEDFATATAEFTAAIGLQRFGIYGYHTGSGIAVALAHQYPERVSAIACNGLVMLTQPELDNILAHYLPRFEPSWDGAHLAWLWARLREQTIFFPWHDRRLATRMNFPMREPEALQQQLLEFLRAGDAYRVGYRAAFAYQAGPVLTQISVPSLITAASRDPLSEHLQRIASPADCVKIEISEDHAAALETCFAHLLGYPGTPAPQAVATQMPPAKLWSDTLATTNGRLRVLRSGEQIKNVVVHAAGGSAETVAPLLLACRHALAVDLPGHGEAPAPEGDCDLRACADQLQAVLSALDGEPVWLVGDGSGAAVALEVARRDPARLRGLIIKDAPLPDPKLRAAILSAGLPDLQPDWHGGHLSRAWHMLRDARLFHPWFDRSQAGIRWIEPQLDEQALTLAVRETLIAEGHWQNLSREVLDLDLLSQVSATTLPVLCCAENDSPWQAAAQQLAAAARHGQYLALSTDSAAWIAPLQRAMQQQLS